MGVLYTFYPRTTDEPADVVARVGGEVITRHDIETRTRQAVINSQKGGLSVPEDLLFDRSLDDLITESLLFQGALKDGFYVDEEEVNRRYEYAETEYKRIQGETGSTQTFLERMAENLMTPEEFRRNIGRQIVLFAYLEELKRQEVNDMLNAAIIGDKKTKGAYLEVDTEKTPVTSEDISLISQRRADELREEFSVEVYLE